MFKVTEYRKTGRANMLFLDDGSGDARMHLIPEGMIEAYMGTYGIPAGVALTMILADGSVDGIDMPGRDDPDFKKKISAGAKKAAPMFDWSAVNRDQVLADITLADDLAEQLVNSWAVSTEAALAEEPMSSEEAMRDNIARAKSLSEGHEQRNQEILAADYISSMPTDLLQAPRGGESVEPAGADVAWGIQFVD